MASPQELAADARRQHDNCGKGKSRQRRHPESDALSDFGHILTNPTIFIGVG